MQEIHAAASIRLRFSHTGEYLLQNIPLEANIHKTLSKFHILAGRQSARDNSSGNNGQDVKAQGTIVLGTTGRTSKRKGQ
jgi:hypothetical protein